MQPALDALLSGTARDPVRHALALETLDRQLRPLLPPQLAAHVRLANVVDGRLVFLVDSPVWHARLRLAADELLDAARSIGLQVREVAIKASSQPLRPPAQTAPKAPATAAQHRQSAATEAGLRAALAALASSSPDAPEQGKR